MDTSAVGQPSSASFFEELAIVGASEGSAGGRREDPTVLGMRENLASGRKITRKQQNAKRRTDKSRLNRLRKRPVEKPRLSPERHEKKRRKKTGNAWQIKGEGATCETLTILCMAPHEHPLSRAVLSIAVSLFTSTS